MGVLFMIEGDEPKSTNFLNMISHAVRKCADGESSNDSIEKLWFRQHLASSLFRRREIMSSTIWIQIIIHFSIFPSTYTILLQIDSSIAHFISTYTVSFSYFSPFLWRSWMSCLISKIYFLTLHLNNNTFPCPSPAIDKTSRPSSTLNSTCSSNKHSIISVSTLNTLRNNSFSTAWKNSIFSWSLPPKNAPKRPANSMKKTTAKSSEKKDLCWMKNSRKQENVWQSRQKSLSQSIANAWEIY